MSNTTKEMSGLDQAQVIRDVYNEVNDSLSTDGFLVGKVGRKITLAISTTSVANDTETYAFSESGTALYTLVIIYTDGNRTVMISSERTA